MTMINIILGNGKKLKIKPLNNGFEREIPKLVKSELSSRLFVGFLKKGDRQRYLFLDRVANSFNLNTSSSIPLATVES